MSGIKGRSGRKSMRDEERRQRIIDKAWMIAEQIMDSNNSIRFQVAKDIVIKDMATKLDAKGEGFGDKIIIINAPKEKKDIEIENKSSRIPV